MSDIQGFKEPSRKLNQLEKKAANKIVRRGTAKMAQVVRKEMRRMAPRKTGTLRKELRYKITRSRNGGFNAETGAFNKAFYAKFLEEGAKAHDIPKKKGRRISIRGKVVQGVRHPGIKGTRFLSKAFERSRRHAVKEAGEIMFKEMKKL